MSYSLALNKQLTITLMRAKQMNRIVDKYYIFGLIISSLFLASFTQAAPPAPLKHKDLNTNIPLPRYVYRVDSRSPEQIFRDGFTSRGAGTSITQYVRGGDYLAQASYISTTASEDTAAEIASSQVNDTYRNAWTCDSTGRIQCRSWVYVISPQNSNFFSMVDNLPDTPQYRRYFGQREWVAVDRIYSQHIQSAYPVTRYFNNGIPDGPAIFNSGQTRQNNGYSLSTPGYAPPGFSNAILGPTRLNCNAQCP